MKTSEGSFAETHFGAAQLGHQMRNRCLVKIADLIHRHPGGTLPTKLHEPKDYKAMDRLMNRPEVTHAAVLQSHREHTLQQMRQRTGVVLVVHDTTEVDYSGLLSITDQGPIGGGYNRGFLCRNSLAFDPQQHEVIGLTSQILHRRRPVGRQEGVKAKRARMDRESRLWVDGLAGVGLAPEGSTWVHVADRGADTFEFMARLVSDRQNVVIRSQTNRVILV